MDTKPIYLSKTFWMQVIAIAVLLLGTKLPGVSDFLKTYFAEVGTGWAVVNMILRLVSKDQISLT